MRIISQNKTTDVPYDSSVICVEVVNKSIYDINTYFGDKWFLLGTYKTLDNAKAVLWDIATKNKEKKTYYEMPQTNNDLTYSSTARTTGNETL